MIGTSKNHCHNHNAPHPDIPHPHADMGPHERLDRLCMILEAQFGPDIAPIETPKIDHLIKRNSQPPSATSQAPDGAIANESSVPPDGMKTEEGDENDFTEEEVAEIAAMELERLRSLGIPYPGIQIRVDQHIARVWLETMEVDCAFMVLKQRVKAVVERAMETVSGLWKTWGWRDHDTDPEAKSNEDETKATAAENAQLKNQAQGDPVVKMEDDDENVHIKQEVEA